MTYYYDALVIIFCILFTREAHLRPYTSLQVHHLIENLKNRLVLLVVVLKTISKHQAADDVGHSVVYQ